MSTALVAVLALVTTSSTAEPGDLPRRPEPPPAPRASPPPAPPRRPDPPPTPQPPRGPEPAKVATDAAPKTTDHEQVLDRIGVGWFGVSNVLVGVDGDTVVAPTLGARIWLDEGMGVDLGLGLAFQTTGGQESAASGGETELDGATTIGFLAHVALPFALYASDHYTFLAIPEANFGFAQTKSSGFNSGVGDSVDLTETGLRFELGARVGAEIQFGFIGIPELALEASVGARFAHQRVRRGFEGASVRVSTSSLQTLSLNDPWDFFRSTVAARYYF